MATTKITNAIALAAAIAILNGEDNTTGFDTAQVVAKLEKMHASATKSRKTNGPRPLTKEQRMNLAIIEDAANQIANLTEPFGTQWIKDNVQYVTSAQKATAIARALLADGKIKKLGMVKGKMTYAPIDYVALEDDTQE